MTYRAKGLLKAPDPNQPLNVESLNNQIKLSLIVTYMNVPNCAQITQEPVKGYGFLDAKANPTTNGSTMDLKLGPPIGLQWDMANTVACDGKVSTAISSGVLSSSKDPWIEMQFPNGEGTYAVNIDILDQTVKNMNQAAGHHATYKATLHMEKVIPQ